MHIIKGKKYPNNIKIIIALLLGIFGRLTIKKKILINISWLNAEKIRQNP
jgi:hypothetical protein